MDDALDDSTAQSDPKNPPDLSAIADISNLAAPTAPAAPAVPPPGVPPTALWVDDAQEWQQGGCDDAGAQHGPFRSWRADGTLRTVATHSHGKQVGPAWRFHPDGSLFELGTFVDGSPRGSHRRYASIHSHVERLQSCCVPEGAWQLRQDYDHGEMRERAWFNRDGARLLDSGALYPERPATVPPRAWFNENLAAWEAGGIWEESGYTGTRRRWSVDGVLRLCEDLVRGKRHGTVQSFDESGALAWEGQLTDGRLSGPFRAHGLPMGHFGDQTACDEEGSFFEDQAVDRWRVRDRTGAIRAERDLGQALDEQCLTSSPALSGDARSADSWGELADALFAQRRVAEGLLAAARATAAAGDPGVLTNALATWAIPLGVQAARTKANDIVEHAAESLLVLVDALKRGGDAAILLWAVAKALSAAERAALDFVTAALLLRPDWTEPLTTRALLYGSLGDLSSARADIARLHTESPDGAGMLELILRAYFPRFDFWPAREAFEIRPDGATVRPEREVPEVRDVIMRYATRLHRLRTALRARVAEDVAFMIPDLSSLLPAGPLPLATFTFTMSAEEYGGGQGEAEAEAGAYAPPVQPEEPAERVEITVDETQGLSPQASSLLPILRQARADWSALTWLCWAVGLDAPGLPTEIRPPSAFGSAALMTMERTWRCRDKLNTSGLLALTKGVPGFDWEGTPIDLVPVTLAEIALGEYIEARAVFSWLCDRANRSPWQDDLRNGD